MSRLMVKLTVMSLPIDLHCFVSNSMEVFESQEEYELLLDVRGNSPSDSR